MNLPKFITFTGADEHTDINRMLSLSRQYPIEWGILFSPKRQGSGRYPPFHAIQKIAAFSHKLSLSAHLCGDYSRTIVEHGALPIYREFNFRSFLPNCKRIQINTSATALPLDDIKGWAYTLRCRAIVQCRDEFPEDDRVDWLFDASGGRGIFPDTWPIRDSSHAAKTLKGYAGGLGPENVGAVAKQIGEWDPAFWLDMESGIRDDGDRFDLDKCEQVCRAVYGPRSN